MNVVSLNPRSFVSHDILIAQAEGEVIRRLCTVNATIFIERLQRTPCVTRTALSGEARRNLFNSGGLFRCYSFAMATRARTQFRVHAQNFISPSVNRGATEAIFAASERNYSANESERNVYTRLRT